jgi:hypothetical protein
MKTLRYLLLFSLIFMVSIADAQEFKIIKDTTDYVLKEVDSGYYYSHGVEAKNDFVIDTNKIHKVNGVLKLPLNNGKFVEFRDTLVSKDAYPIFEYLCDMYSIKLDYYLVIRRFGHQHDPFLVNKSNGIIDSLFGIPIISPNDLYFAYANFNYLPNQIYVGYKDRKRNKFYSINWNGNRPRNIKWINDFSFLFEDLKAVDIREQELIIKYYRVDIKH